MVTLRQELKDRGGGLKLQLSYLQRRHVDPYLKHDFGVSPVARAFNSPTVMAASAIQGLKSSVN